VRCLAGCNAAIRQVANLRYGTHAHHNRVTFKLRLAMFCVPFPGLMTVKLSLLAICMGLFVALVNLAGLLAPDAITAIARKFPRNTFIGYLLMAIGTVWFVYNVSIESLADFE